MAKTIEQLTEAINNLGQMAIRTRGELTKLLQSADARTNNGETIAGLKHQMEQAIATAAAYRELYNERAKLINQGSAGGGSKVGTLIPGGTPGPTTDAAPAASQAVTAIKGLDSVAKEFQATLKKAIAALETKGYTVTGVTAAKSDDGTIRGIINRKVMAGGELINARDFKYVGDTLGNWGNSLKEMKRMRFINSDVNKPLLSYAEKFNYRPEDYRSTKSEGGGAYKLSRFERVDEFGATQRHDFRVDKQGGISTAPVGKQYQSFTQGIGKDIGDLLKWSVAISAIYGPLNAMSEAMSQLIENESKLADVSIALNPQIANTDRVFKDVYQSAKASGESISGVIDAFGAAYTAAGRISDGNQRYAASVKLLDDSLVLSKLSTLDQAGAIDVLTSALYQTGDASASAEEKLSRGRALIDQWVQVSKIASVSVETLATGVAVLGDSAETAGLSLEQLNALVATISETSLSSGKETANIAKALIGNYQQESAVKELNRLGIAVVDTTGKTRQFLDVMKDVAALRSQGLLGNQDFSRLTLALGGGGIRRQKDVAAFIENFGRMEQIAGSQGGAGGSSAEALAKKLDTVQTASTNLANSFTNLAQTLGTKGGLLDVFSGTLNTGSKMVDMLDKLAAAAGKTAPLLAAVAVGALLLGKGGLIGATDKLAANFTGPMAERMGYGSYEGTIAAQRLTGQRAMIGSNRMGGLNTLPTAAAIALPAVQNLAAGDTREAGANIAGGIAGALVGGPVGALVGSAIAESFVRTTMTYDSELSNFFAGVITKTKEGGTQKEVSADLMTKAFKEIGAGDEGLGKLRAWVEKISSYPRNKGGQIIGEEGGYATNESAALALLEKKNPALAAQIKSQFAITGGVPEGTTTRLTARQKEIANTPGTSEYLKRMQSEEQDKLRTELITGKIKPSDYANRLSSVSAFSVTAPRYMAAMEDQVGGVGDAFKSTEDAYKAFLEILSSGNQESINNINAQIATIDNLKNIWDTWAPGKKTAKFSINGVEADWSKAQLGDAIATANAGLGIAAKDAAQQARLTNLPVRDIYGGNTAPAPVTDINRVIQETVKLQDRKYNNLEPADYTALKDSWEPFYVLVEDAGKIFYKQVVDSTGKLDKSLFGEAYQSLQESGQIMKPGGGKDFTQLDITQPQLKMAETQANVLTKKLEGVGYKSNVTDTLVATSDQQITSTHADMKILQYVLQQILDTEKKQLQGIWNMPEGASFWVPLQSMIAGGKPGGTFSDFGLKDPKVNPSTDTRSSETGQAWFKTPFTNGFKSIDKAAQETLQALPPTRSTFVKGDKWWEDSSVKGKAPAESTSAIDQLMNILKSVFAPIGSLGAGSTSLFPGSAGMKGGKTYSPSQTETAAMQTKMDIKFTSTTNLMVDGRVLASIVKPYLAADLLKTNESGGTVTRSYVI